MTKREWDLLTVENWGGPMGNRTEYRAARAGHPTDGKRYDYVTARAQCVATRNRYERDSLATLAMGTIWRAWAYIRRAAGRPMLAPAGASI
jgi:hypothetical protein